MCLHKTTQKMDRNTIRKPIQSSHSFPAPITPPKDNHSALLLTCKPCYDPRAQRHFHRELKDMHDKMVKLIDENSRLTQLLTEMGKELFLLKHSDINDDNLYPNDDNVL